MTAAAFRKLALSFPDVVEGEHMGHPDFRRAGKIFATLGAPDANWGMLKLSPDEQPAIVASAPETFEPAKGGWGRQGSTLVNLRAARAGAVQPALRLAWELAAPKAPGRRRSKTDPPA